MGVTVLFIFFRICTRLCDIWCYQKLTLVNASAKIYISSLYQGLGYASAWHDTILSSISLGLPLHMYLGLLCEGRSRSNDDEEEKERGGGWVGGGWGGESKRKSRQTDALASRGICFHLATCWVWCPPPHGHHLIPLKKTAHLRNRFRCDTSTPFIFLHPSPPPHPAPFCWPLPEVRWPSKSQWLSPRCTDANAR